MTTRQYIGARYVPTFFNNPDGSSNWIQGVPYEALTIVTYLNNSYTSKKPVPVGIDILNTEYWALTGNYNGQVETYRQQVETYRQQVETYHDEIDQVKESVTELDTKYENITNNIQNEINVNKENIAKNSNDILTINDLLNLKLKERYLVISDSYGDSQNSWGNTLINYIEETEEYVHFCLPGCGFDPKDPTKKLLTRMGDIQVSDKNLISKIVICMGYNDATKTNVHENTVKAAVIETLQAFHTQYPNAHIYIGMIGANANYSDSDIRQNLSKVTNGYKNGLIGKASYINDTENILHYYPYLGNDGFHPLDSSGIVIAKYIAEGLKMGSCGVKYGYFTTPSTNVINNQSCSFSESISNGMLVLLLNSLIFSIPSTVIQYNQAFKIANHNLRLYRDSSARIANGWNCQVQFNTTDGLKLIQCTCQLDNNEFTITPLGISGQSFTCNSISIRYGKFIDQTMNH